MQWLNGMQARTDPLSKTFVALSDPTRRAILDRLARGEAAAGELSQPFRLSGAAVSRHLKVLSDAGLVERTIVARWRIYRLRPAELQAANDWLSQYRKLWEEQLDRLVEYVERTAGDQGASSAGGRRRSTGQTRTSSPRRRARP